MSLKGLVDEWDLVFWVLTNYFVIVSSNLDSFLNLIFWKTALKSGKIISGLINSVFQIWSI
jgi:hypothetical protein